MQRLLLILMDQKDGSLSVKKLKDLYEKSFAETLDVQEVMEQLGNAVKVRGNLFLHDFNVGTYIHPHSACSVLLSIIIN